MIFSIIIPCYNEEKRIGPTLTRVADYVHTKVNEGWEVEVIVVDNGSKDATQKVARLFAEHINGLEIIDRKDHEGLCCQRGDASS